MKHIQRRRIWLLGISLFLGCVLSGCETVTEAPTVSSAEAVAEEKLQRELYVKGVLDERRRLMNVAGPILVRSVEYCGTKTRPYLGMRVATIQDYSMNGMAGKFRDAAISTLNLNEKLRVIYVISGSPAEKAEIQPGDIILGMNGQEAPTGADARKAFRKFIKQTKGDIHISMEGTSGVRQVTMSPLQSCDYGVELVEDEKINAHAGLTSIAVTRGMLRYADDDNELALVVSHELAHVAMGHVEKTLERATGGFLVDMVFAVVLGVDTQGFFTKTAAKIYSKEQEAEADYVGLYLMARAGYEFRDAANFWRRMAMISPGSIGEGHWATHPSTAKRFAAIKKTVDEIKAKKDAGLPLAPKFRRSPLKRDTNDSL